MDPSRSISWKTEHNASTHAVNEYLCHVEFHLYLMSESHYPVSLRLCNPTSGGFQPLLAQGVKVQLQRRHGQLQIGGGGRERVRLR